MDAPRFKLKLTRLDFISPVDSPAQETAKVLLIKRKGEVDGAASVVKVSEELGLVFCWAFTSKAAGSDYYDLHGDTIDQDFVAAAASFMERGGVTDEMHDGSPDGRVVFAMPMTPDIAKAYGIQTDTVGLMVALKPSPDVLAKFKSGEYTGVSIQGMGERVSARKSISVPVEIDVAAATVALDELLVKAKQIEESIAKSTRSAAVPHGQLKMTLEDATTEIETLKAKLAESEKRAALTPEERSAEFEKSDPVAYRGEVSGITVRKSEASDFALKLAKAHEAQAVALAKANETAEVEKAAKANEILKARVKAEIGHLPGSDETKLAVLKAVESIDGALEMLKGADAFAASKTEAPGIGGSEPPKAESPQVELDALIAAETAKGVAKSAATDAVMKTAKGKELYAQIQKNKKAAR